MGKYWRELNVINPFCSGEVTKAWIVSFLLYSPTPNLQA
jgi:hypothetical protein